MIALRNEMHIRKVNEWETSHGTGLSSKELVNLYSSAIQAMVRRSLETLSAITVLVVLDRVLNEVKEGYPFLSEIKADSQGINFDSFLEKEGLDPEEFKRALHEFLVGLLTVLGNITADILTTPLHKELMTISVASAKKNRDPK
jgi:hypothetical protein